MRPEIEVAGPAGTGPIYRRAALGLLRRRGRAATLPATAYCWRGAAAEPRQLAAYTTVCGFHDLCGVLPPTYPHVMAFPLAMQLMTQDSFPFPVVGLIHAANWMRVTRLIGADESMTIRVYADGLRRHDRGHEFDLVATATIGTEEVWQGRSTYLRRQRSDPRRAGRAPATRLEIPKPLGMWTVPAAVGPAYARASGDHNPIHTSRLAARLAGFGRPIVHGMWSKARCLAAIDRPAPPYTVDVRFKRPIRLPATVAWSTDGARFGLHDPVTGQPHLTGRLS
jgi:hypothetical protein